jgi:hypothetical protein
VGLFNASFYLSLVGYIAWAAAALSRGASLQLALGVLKGDKGASYVMKEVYLGTITGVTTLTQLGMVMAVLAVLIALRFGWRRVAFKCAVLFLITMVRALMNSERLALMELAVPAGVLLVRLAVLESPRYFGRVRTLLRMAPALGYGGLVVVFGCSEYFRSWVNYYAGGDLSFWQFVSLRLLGYYVTALNNGALLVQRLDPTGAPFFTFHLLWKFPVLSGIVQMIYPNLAIASVDGDPYMQVLSAEANPEFNNGGGLLLPVIDFGFAGALLYWTLAGIACGALYRLFRHKTVAGLVLYPLVFIGVIEATRIIYWAEGRLLVPFCTLAAYAIACAWRQRGLQIHTHQDTATEHMAWDPSH